MRFETEEIHLIYIRRKYTLYIRNTFRKPKATELASIENVWHEKNQQQPCISVNLTFLFSPVHVSTCIMPPKQQTIFLPLSTPKWNKMKKQLPKIRKSMLTFLSGSLSADKVTHFMKHEPEVARLLSEKTGSLCHILTSSLKHAPNSTN